MSRKRARANSPVRVQISRPRVAASEEPPQPTQVNTHIHVGVDMSAGSRHTVRTEHVTRPMQTVDLSSLLAAENEGDLMVDADAEFDSFSAENASYLPSIADEEVVEDPEATGTAGEQEDESRRPVGEFSFVLSLFSLTNHFR